MFLTHENNGSSVKGDTSLWVDSIAAFDSCIRILKSDLSFFVQVAEQIV